MNNRSYEKESYKSKPTGIRFNLEQERIAFMRSKKKTRQQLVDFLLDNYVKGENPILAIQDSTQPTNEVKPITDEKPKTNYEVKIEPKPISSVMGDFEGMKNEIFSCETIAQIKDIDKKIKVALFSFRQKAELENLAKQHSATLYND